MKKEMKMLDNGNYEEVISFIQHACQSEDRIIKCVQYSSDIGKLHIEIEEGDPYEDGYCRKFLVAYCPFCGYQCKSA